jgi:Dullard-like phosphatase family protein
MNNVENFSRQGDAKIKVQLPGGKQITIGINIRPHWEQALDIIRDKYHIIAYTASHESYADSVLNYLDPDKKYFEYRLYRSHCVLCVINEMKFYVKDLGILEDCCDLKDVVLIDNSVLSFAYHLDNGIPISPFYDSKNDCELLDISNFLIKYADEDDLRNRLREVYKLNEYLEIIKNYSSEDSVTDSSSISIVQEDEEGEKTNKNNNKHNLALNLSKSSKNNTIHEKEADSIDIKNNNTFILNENKLKNCSQRNFKFKEIIDLFDKEEQNEKKSKSFSHREKRNKKLESKSNINISKNIDKSWCLLKRKNKYKSFRNFDINFKKEWDEKQKELNNNK